MVLPTNLVPGTKGLIFAKLPKGGTVQRRSSWRVTRPSPSLASGYLLYNKLVGGGGAVQGKGLI